MKNLTVEEVKNWPVVKLIRGIRLTYKSRDMYFPRVYLGPSEMDDFDAARASLEFKEASADNKEITAQRKAMTLCSRVILSEGYLNEKEQIDIQTKFALRERARKKLEHKLEEAEDEFLVTKLTKELEELVLLPKPAVVFPEERIVSFNVSNMAGAGILPIDNVRIQSAYQQLNYFEQEDVNDFLELPEQ